MSWARQRALLTFFRDGGVWLAASHTGARRITGKSDVIMVAECAEAVMMVAGCAKAVMMVAGCAEAVMMVGGCAKAAVSGAPAPDITDR
ncbi:MAG: hypothetical protein ACRDNO_12765 [Trebonia sp.]